MTNPASSSQITRMLKAWSDGNEDALHELLPLVYAELRRQAARHLRRERPGPHAADDRPDSRGLPQARRTEERPLESRTHFFAIASQLMRRILVDYARTRHRAKRGGDDVRLCGESGAQPLLNAALRERPGDTLLSGLWAPTVRAAAELNGDANKAVETLETTRAWEPAAGFWTHYLRGQADMKLGKATEAAVEFRQILSHSGEAPLSILYPLAQLGLARASAQAGDGAGAAAAYRDFLEGWKDGDPDLAELRSARSEFANLKNSEKLIPSP